MINQKISLGMLAIALVFGMMVIGCDEGSGGSNDPINVDMSLPAIATVPDFSGDFVSTETDAYALIKEVLGMVAVDVSSPSFSMQPSIAQRMVTNARTILNESEPFEEIYVENTELIPGALVTGFITGYDKIYLADDDDPFGSKGDYSEMAIRIKIAASFPGTTPVNNFTIKGKYAVNSDISMKMQTASLNPYSMKITMKADSSENFVLSISKNGKGLKFVMKLQAKMNGGLTLVEETDIGDIDSLFDYDLYTLTIDVYDNSNTKKHSVSLDSFEAVVEFLGLD